MPLDPLTMIAGPESSYGTNLQNPTSTASGVWQDINSTWTSGLSAIGGNPAQYPTAISAPASVQAAVNAYEYNTYGFQPWTIGDPTLAADIAAAGGPSAFAAPGTLSTNPATYASLDQPGGLAAYFASNGATVPAGAGTPAQTTTASFTGQTFAPFTWLYTQYTGTIQNSLNNAVAQLQTTAAGPVSGLLVLLVMVLGFATMWGRMPVSAFFNRLVRVAIVVALIAPGAVWYQTYVVGLFTGLPQWLASSLTGVATTSAAGVFDQVSFTFWSHASAVWSKLPWGFSALFFDAPILGVCFAVVYGTLIIMFTVFLITQALTGLLLVLGPILVLGLLFDYTLAIFNQWIGRLITLALVTLAVDALVTLILGIVLAALNGISPTSSASADLMNLFGVAIVVGVLSAAVIILPRLLEAIGGGAGAAEMGQGHRWLSAGAYRPAARVARALPTTLFRSTDPPR